jgi:Rha family phage regulatory protein
MLVEIVGKRYEEKIVTTSRKIAEGFEKRHSDVLRDIENLGCSEEFRQRNFALSSYTSEQNKKLKEYIVTEDGFTILCMGYGGERAMEFKERYIAEFNTMREELKKIHTERQQWQIERDKGVVIRHILTDTIKMKITESPNKRFAYPNYTNLIYRNLFGKTAKELENDYGVKAKENLRDFFTGDDLAKVQSMEMLVSSLINCGWGYQQIKEFIQNEATKLIA